MTASGWLFLAAAWGGVIALVVYCFSRILRDDRPGE